MMTLAQNVVKEKLRSKVIYILIIIGALFMLLITTGDGLSIDGIRVLTFSQRVPVAIGLNTFIGMLISIIISQSTIPNEFERKTTHLILSRGIKREKFTLSLALGNIMTTVICVFAINISLIIFVLVLGKSEYLGNVLVAILITTLNVVTMSAIVSLLSIHISSYVNILVSLIIYFLGVSYQMITQFISGFNGFLSVILNLIIKLIPNFQAVEHQANHVMLQETIEIRYILWMFVFFIISFFLTLIKNKKEV